MSIAGRIPRPKALLSGEIEKMILSVFGGGSTSSGVSISSESAMKQATVYSCVNILSRVIGMLPCHMMERIGKNREIAENFYLYPLLHDMPNEWMTSAEFWGMVEMNVLLRGNCYVLKNRGVLSKTRQIKELIPLAPGIVQEVVQNTDYSLVYRCVFPDGTQTDIPGTEIMHLRGLVSNGYMGMNPIQYIRETIGLGLATEEFGARYFGSGTHPSMIVEHPKELSEVGHKNLRESLSETYSGLGKAHRLMLLEEGMKANPISINPEDSQFLETRQYQRADIVDIFFGMPLKLMGSNDSTPTFASAEQFSINFIMYALLPWAVSFEKAIYRDLLTESERTRYYAKFRMEGLQRGSFKEQAEAFAILIDKEIMNPNECRELLDRNPYGGGDEYRTRTSTTKGTDKEKQNEPVV